MSPSRRRRKLSGSEPDIEELRPFLGLAREISEHVRRLSTDGQASPQALADVMDSISAGERRDLVLSSFRHLSAEAQWELIERIFGDEEIKQFLSDERNARLDAVRRQASVSALARRARAEQRLDTRDVGDHDVLTLGLFRESDVRAAVALGGGSGTCARRVVLRPASEPAVFHVLEDVFNPRGGLFVTAEYDRQTWQQLDRLEPNAVVRVGSLLERPEGTRFEPVLYPGGRTDFEVEGTVRVGRLHLGFALIGGEDIFVQKGGSQ